MTNTLAIILGLLIAGFFALDHYMFDWGATIFLMRKLMELIEHLAFWR